jgi:hypothetical protein
MRKCINWSRFKNAFLLGFFPVLIIIFVSGCYLTPTGTGTTSAPTSTTQTSTITQTRTTTVQPTTPTPSVPPTEQFRLMDLRVLSVGFVPISVPMPPHQGQSFIMQIPVAGGLPPYTWKLLTGSLPAGLTLGANGLITGIPTTTGMQTFNVAVFDATGSSAAGSFSLNVDKIPDIATTTPTADRGLSPEEQMWASGKHVDFWVAYPTNVYTGNFIDLAKDQYVAITPYVLCGKQPWSFTVVGLPKGLTYDSATGLIQGPVAAFADGNVKGITAAAKDADGKDPYQTPATFSIRAGYVAPTYSTGTGNGKGVLSVSADRGMIISVSGIGDIGIGGAVISLAPGNYTVSIRNPSTNQIIWQTTVRIDAGKTTTVKASGLQ